ncbi:MAG: 50S ribosome-binding GTPase [Candidatus Riesia sp.]|nr:50S ribosome-binding GTPase [Candidatus Riesia sp.]
MTRIVILGKKNVGKSSLFNLLSGSNNAVAVDYEGYTRDCKYVTTKLSDRLYEVIDTPGLGYSNDSITLDAIKSVWRHVKTSNLVLLLLTIDDLDDKALNNILTILKKNKCRVIYVLNKIDELSDLDINNFFIKINTEYMVAISVKNVLNINELVNLIKNFGVDDTSKLEKIKNIFKMSVVGRENVGKSLFVNKILGYSSSLVYDYPGITRDLLETVFTKNNRKYLLVDTPGIKKNVKNNIYRLASDKSTMAIGSSNMCLIVIDLLDVLNRQDLSIIKSAFNLCKTNILIFNKSDLKTKKDLIDIENDVKNNFKFLKSYQYHFISSKYNLGFKSLFWKIDRIKSIHSLISFKSVIKNIKDIVNNSELFLRKNLKIKKIKLLDSNIFSIYVYLNCKQVPDNLKKLLCTMIIKHLNLKSFSFKFYFK